MQDAKTAVKVIFHSESFPPQYNIANMILCINISYVRTNFPPSLKIMVFYSIEKFV